MLVCVKKKRSIRMIQEFQIMIADRNPRVREFLKREMTAEGYKVCEAENLHQILQKVIQPEKVDLLIIDPDLPDVNEVSIVERFFNHYPNIPVIIHTIHGDDVKQPILSKAKAVIEKRGNSVETLKSLIYEFYKSDIQSRKKIFNQSKIMADSSG